MNRIGLLETLSQENIEYCENCLLAPYTTFRIGGPAGLAVFPKSSDEAVKALGAVRSSGLRYLVLGNGSNVLIDDGGFDGAVVILTGMRAFSVGDGVITADAGLSLTRLASIAAANSLTGLEFAYGIPGTVGGGVYMNAGAYGGELAQVAVSSRWYDMETGETGEYSGAEQDFSYRHSVYMNDRKIILSATFRLAPGERDKIGAAMDDYMSRRREKQPLELPSAGSVFKRGNGFITAKLIEDAGLKGRRVGDAEVSEKHAGFIVNRGKATSADVLGLIEVIKREIRDKFGKDIECEVRYIGS